jgi:hypothetical protein
LAFAGGTAGGIIDVTKKSIELWEWARKGAESPHSSPGPHSSSVGADPSLSGGATGLANAAEANLAGANASPAANEATLMGNFSVGLSGYR